MPDEVDPDVQRAVKAIAAYLVRNPQAADSEQGIAQWWLLASGLDMPLSTVSRALEQMIAFDRIERALLPDGRAIYRAPAESAPQVRCAQGRA